MSQPSNPDPLLLFPVLTLATSRVGIHTLKLVPRLEFGNELGSLFDAWSELPGSGWGLHLNGLLGV